MEIRAAARVCKKSNYETWTAKKVFVHTYSYFVVVHKERGGFNYSQPDILSREFVSRTRKKNHPSEKYYEKVREREKDQELRTPTKTIWPVCHLTSK